MSLMIGLLIVFMLSVGVLVVINDWRITVPLLTVAEFSRIGLLVQSGVLSAGSGRSPVLLVDLTTALSVAGILLVTALTFTRDYNTEQLDEFALLELRSAARRSRQRTRGSGQWVTWIVPIGAVLLAAFATLLLGRAYPIARQAALDTAWIFALLCGLLILVTTSDVLKLGLGLLLIASSAKVLYFSVAPSVNVLHIGLLELLTLILTVLVAYLSGLLYGRLHTLDSSSVFDGS